MGACFKNFKDSTLKYLCNFRMAYYIFKGKKYVKTNIIRKFWLDRIGRSNMQNNFKTITRAVIPAAGLGTRFLPATKATPKEMRPIVDKPTI